MMIERLGAESRKRYDEDARSLIQQLLDGRIELKNGELNPMGVQILIESAHAILQNETVTEAAAKAGTIRTPLEPSAEA